MRAAGDDTGVCAVHPDRILRPRRRGFPNHLECDEFFPRAVDFLFRENGAAIEFVFVERDKKSQPGLDGRGLLVQFMAIKRVADLGAQGVARTEAARFDAEWLPGGKQSIPNVPDGFVRTDDFESVFAGIARARDQHAAVFKVKAGDLVFLQFSYATHTHGRT